MHQCNSTWQSPRLQWWLANPFSFPVLPPFSAPFPSVACVTQGKLLEQRVASVLEQYAAVCQEFTAYCRTPS